MAAAMESGKSAFMSGVVITGAHMAATVSRLVAMEVVELLRSTLGQRAMVSMTRVEAVVDVPVETWMAVEPGTGSYEQPAHKPVGAVVPVGGTIVWSVIEVAVRAYGRNSNADCNLGRGRVERCAGDQHERET
jgi:hypothetical protein